MLRRTVFAMALGLTVFTASPISAQDWQYEWGNALAEEFRYEGMAETVFTSLAENSDQTRKNQGLIGIAKLRRLQARRAETTEKKDALNKEALEKLRSAAKTLPRGSKDFFEAQFEIADMRQDIASDLIALFELGRIPADKIDVQRKNALNGLNESAGIYETAAERFWNVVKEKKPDEWLLGRRARLSSAILRLYKAELMATDPKKKGGVIWEGELDEARSTLEDFIWEHEDVLVGYHGYLWMGRVLAQLVDAGSSRAKVEDVEENWAIIPTMVAPPKEGAGPDWRPVSESAQSLVQQAYFWLLRFLNKHGRTGKVIGHGEAMVANWTGAKYDFNDYGYMSLVELARAYHEDGRSDAALALASRVTKEGAAYPRREADRMLSMIIRTTLDRSNFDAETLASGANGAYIAGARPGAQREFKNLECIELYQLVLQNLGHVKDAPKRDYLGALSWYRIGICLNRIGRKLESTLAFREGYTKFNREIRADKTLTENLSKSWRLQARDYASESGQSDLGKRMSNEARDWVINNPPKKPGGGTGGSRALLLWQKAEGLYRKKNYDAASKEFRTLADGRSEYKERAMVRLGQCATKALGVKGKDVTAADWIAATEPFEAFRKYVSTNPVGDDAQRVSLRRRALDDADYQLTRCWLKGADAETDAAKQETFYKKVVEASVGFEERSKNVNLTIYVLHNRMKALIGLARPVEAEEAYKAIFKLNPKHGNTIFAAAQIGRAVSMMAKGMPNATIEEAKARDAVRLRAGHYYKHWLEARDSKKPKDWRSIYSIFYGLKKWDTAYEIISRYIKKFDGSRAVKPKDMLLSKRYLAKCILEKAKKAYNDGEKAEAGRLFTEASKIYQVLTSKDSGFPPTTPLLVEAAEIFGGFLVGPNRRGQYTYYRGAEEFEKAYAQWIRIERRLNSNPPKQQTPQAMSEYKWKKYQAKFYKFVCFWKKEQTKNNSKGIKSLKENVTALERKEGGRVGGTYWGPRYKWLIEQL